MKKILALVLLLACCVCTAYAQTPNDVPKEHWAYEAVNDLVSKGYITGYPDGLFHGEKSMTRYEFATIVKHIVDEMNMRFKATDAAIQNAKPGNSGTTVTPVKPSVAPEDLAELKKLVDEFKPELVVIGTRLDNIDTALAELKTKVGDMDAILTDPEGAMETAKTDIAKLKMVSVSGYAQTVFLSQETTTSGAYSGRTDNFRFRRARFKITGKGSENASFVSEVDAGGSSIASRDAYLQYAFAGDPYLGLTLTAGQFVLPFGNELFVSSSLRETPEYSRIVQKFFPGERDRGIKFAGATKDKIRWMFAYVNGSGSNTEDVNTRKDICGNIKASITNWIDLGISGYYGTGITTGIDVNDKVFNIGGKDYVVTTKKQADSKLMKRRLGADLQIYLPDTTIKGEYMEGRGVEGAVRDLNKTIKGYWAQITRNLTLKDVLMVKFDSMSDDPTSKTNYGTLGTWNYGIIHYLDDKTRVKFFYQRNVESKNSFKNDAYIGEIITTF